MAGPWEKYQQPVAGPWSKYAAPAPMVQTPPATPARPEAANPVFGLSRDLINGVPVLGPLYLRGMDQITSRILGPIFGEDPQALRDRVEGEQKAYEEQHPVLSMAGQIAGGTAAMAPLGMTEAGARLFGLVGPSLLKRAAMGGLSGSTINAADETARGGNFGDVALAAGTGGILGAGVGAAAPHVAEALDRGASAVSAALGGTPGTPGGMSRPATDAIVRALSADGTLGPAGVANMRGAGPNAMLADAGPNARSLLDTAVQRSGPGSKLATDAIEARAAQAHNDITAALDTHLGQPQGVYTATGALRNGTAGARDAAYKAAYASPIDYSSEEGRTIEDLMHRVPGSAIDLAKRMMKAEGVKSKQMFAEVADDGTVTIKRMPDVRELDYITRALNQSAKSGEGQGALGGQTDIGRIYGNLARQIRGATKDAVPAYADALETAATPIQQREALDFGAQLLRPGMARDEAGTIIGGMSGPQRQFAKQGVRSQIDEVLANVRAVVSDPNLDARQARKALADLSSPAARQKVALLMNDDAATADLFNKLDQASKALELRAAVASNSRTFARGAMDQAVSSKFDQGIVNQALKGEPVNAARAIVQNITGRTPQGITAKKDKVYEEIARALVGPRGGNATQMLSDLAAFGARKPIPAGYLPGGVSPVTQAIVGSLLGNVSQ